MSEPVAIRKRIVPAGAAVAVAALLGCGAWFGVQAIAAQPAGRVVFLGDTARIDPAELQALSESIRGAGIDSASLPAIREAARRLPWVREATVRKGFPDVVEITLEGHAPLARWADERLVSTRGELFHGDYEGDLPRFVGPEGSEAEMTREYPRLAKALEPIAPLRELRLSARGAWQAVLASGLTVELGRGDVEARLARFVEAWARVPAPPGVRHVDLRYANGFAVQLALAEKRK